MLYKKVVIGEKKSEVDRNNRARVCLLFHALRFSSQPTTYIHIKFTGVFITHPVKETIHSDPTEHMSRFHTAQMPILLCILHPYYDGKHVRGAGKVGKAPHIERLLFCNKYLGEDVVVSAPI